MSPPQIPGYELRQHLGSGAFGSVWQARRLHDDLIVAIKVLHVTSPDARRRFGREMKLLASLRSSPYVVSLFDHGEAGTVPYLVLEFCAGGSLRRWCTELRSSQDVAAIMFDVASGLEAIHARAGFHRDIKPENILLAYTNDRKLQAKLADFGLARAPLAPPTSTMTHSPAGTRGYMAPELYQGSEYSASCDIWSLGMVLIELLTGTRTVKSLDTMPDLSRPLVELARRMTASDQQARPTAQEVVTALRAVLSLQPAVKPVASPKSQVQPARQGSGAGGWIAAALALLAVASLAGNSKDTNGRWRDGKGRYRSGRFD